MNKAERACGRSSALTEGPAMSDQQLPRPVLDQDLISAIVQLFDDEMSRGYISPETLSSYFRSPEVLVCYELIDGNVAGAGIAKRALNLADVTPPDQLAAVKDATRGILSPEFGYLSGVAVSSQYRGQGLGTKLCAEMVAWMQSRDLSSVLSFGWQDHDGCHAEGAAARAGLHRVATIDNFWHQSTIDKGNICPTCGIPCRCTAVVLAGNIAREPRGSEGPPRFVIGEGRRGWAMNTTAPRPTTQELEALFAAARGTHTMGLLTTQPEIHWLTEND
jgi:GNAT superfamily N-acetyltransferase